MSLVYRAINIHVITLRCDPRSEIIKLYKLWHHYREAQPHRNRQKLTLGGVDHSAAASGADTFQALDAAANAGPEQSPFLISLGNVVLKLDLFVQIVDKTAKVGMSNWDVLGRSLMVVKGSSLCRFRLESDFLALQGRFMC